MEAKKLSAGLVISLPPWAEKSVSSWGPCTGDEEKMRLVIELARGNVLRETGGPFAAAVFNMETGRAVSAGVNSVVRLNNSTLHAEMMAFMLAEQRLGVFRLRGPGLPPHELVTSCEPCAMCLGAVLWSGVERVVCGCVREDAARLRFDEGPVFPESYRYLEERGIEFVRGVLRPEARAVLELYHERGGLIYNG